MIHTDLLKSAMVALTLASFVGAASASSTKLTVVMYDNTTRDFVIDETGSTTVEEKQLLVKESGSKAAEILTLADIDKMFVASDDRNSVSEAGARPSVSLYPNPAQDEVFVSGLEQDKMTVEIFSIIGMKVMQTEVENGKSINISRLAPGLYIVRVAGQTLKLRKK